MHCAIFVGKILFLLLVKITPTPIQNFTNENIIMHMLNLFVSDKPISFPIIKLIA